MKEELISVVVPIYNVEKYLRLCLDSLLVQTYTNFEVLMINDGSPDDSANICKEYLAKDRRFQYFEKENGGLSDARNYGIECSKGEYITFVDSDDWLKETFLADLYEAITRTGADIALSTYIKYDDSTSVYEVPILGEYYERIWTSDEWIRELPKIEMEDNSYSVTWAKLFKRDMFNVIRFPKGKLIEDTRTNIKLFLEASRITYIHKGLYFYRIRGGSIIQTVTEKLLEDVLDTLVERLCLVTIKGLYSDIYKNALLESLKFRSYQAYTCGLENTEIYRRYQEMLYLIEKMDEE
ncbi:glycosyltransferase [Streptococcus mitis]|jgi:capsular polysaccharide biosynthesis protein cpsJ